MEYTVTIFYKDGFTTTVSYKNALQLLADVSGRIVDNEHNLNVDYWTVRPVPGTERN